MSPAVRIYFVLAMAGCVLAAAVAAVAYRRRGDRPEPDTGLSILSDPEPLYRSVFAADRAIGIDPRVIKDLTEETR